MKGLLVLVVGAPRVNGLAVLVDAAPPKSGFAWLLQQYLVIA